MPFGHDAPWDRLARDVAFTDLPAAEEPVPVQIKDQTGVRAPAASDPVPVMRRLVLPSSGDPIQVVPPAPFRRNVWILARGAGGMQASYRIDFPLPDLVDVQVNGIAIPLFPGQYLFFRAVDADPGDDLEVSVIVEPRGSGR